MVQSKAMGRRRLHRKPFNCTLPSPVADAVRAQADDEQRAHSALVEDALRAYLRKVGREIVVPVEMPKRKGGAK